MIISPQNSSYPERCLLPLEEISEYGACQCKLDGIALAELITESAVPTSGDSVYSKQEFQPEDAAIVNLAGNNLLLTVDLNMLVCRDVYKAAQIAALHSLSDIFATLGLPLLALITMLVKPEHGIDVAKAIQAGVLSVCAEEDVTVVGGQTLFAKENFVGLSVIGVPANSKPLRKIGARSGDMLFISKPIGSGVMARAYKLGLITEDDFDAAIQVMLISNRAAMFAAMRAEAVAATDISGFALLGHLSEMLTGDLGAEIYFDQIPFIETAVGLPIGIGRTRWVENNLNYAENRLPIVNAKGFNLNLLADPQTNGPLLIVATAEKTDLLTAAGYSMIGQITNGGVIEIK